MKNKNIILSILLVVIILTLTSLASAVVYQTNNIYDKHTDQELTQVSVIGFICDNADCTSANRELWANTLSTGNDNTIVLEYPTSLISKYGYVVYFFKPGYVPLQIKANWYGEGKTSNYQRELNKIEFTAFAPINSFQISNTQVKVNQAVTISADILSPRVNSNNIKFIPSELEDEYYSDNVKVTLLVNGNTVDSENLNMFWDTEDKVSFSWKPTVEGTYNVKLKTEITDSKFLNKEVKYEEAQIKVTGESNGDTTAPIITVISPKDGKEYDCDEIDFKITTNEAVREAWFIIDGDSTTMDKLSNTKFSETLTLDDGDYEVIFYAEDLVGNIGYKEVEFSIDTDDGDDDDDNNKDKVNNDARYIDDEYYKNKYFDQFQETGSVINIDNTETYKTNINNYYWLISLILIAIILDLIMLILYVRRR